MPERLKGHSLALILLLILLVGVGLRLYNVNWDDFHHVHPDERWITIVAMDTWMPADWREALDPRRSALNPFHNARSGESRRFAYGHFPLYLLVLISNGLAKLSSLAPLFSRWPSLMEVVARLKVATDYDHLNLVGRVLSALFDTGTLLLTFLLARRLYGAKVGLLATVFLTFTVLHIQLAHFYAFDTVMTTFVVAAVYFGVRLVQEGRVREAVALGAVVALAIASKFSAMPVLAVVVAACGLRLFAARDAVQRTGGGDDQAQLPEQFAAVTHQNPTLSSSGYAGVLESEVQHSAIFSLAQVKPVLRYLALSFLVAVLVYALVSPFVLLDSLGFLASMGEQSNMVRGVVDLPYTRQYRNTTPFFYQIKNLFLWGTGVPLGVVGFLGLVYLVLRALRRRCDQAEGVLLAWVVPYYLITNSFMVKFMRYMIVVTPFLCITAAYVLFKLKDWLEGRYGRPAVAVDTEVTGADEPAASRAVNWVSVVWYAVVGLVLVATILYALAFMQVYRHPLTRVEASRWIYRHVPAGAALTAETWDDTLPFNLKVDDTPRSASQYPLVTMNLHEPDNEAKYSHIVASLRQADYVILSSNRMYGWLPRLRHRFPLTHQYYQLLFAEQLGFKLVKTFTSYPRLGGLVLVDDGADESFTVYDHPKVLIFEKVRDLDDEEFREFFADALATAPVERAPQIGADKSLLLDKPVDQLPVVADRGWNPVAKAHPLAAILTWWLVIEVLGLLALPLAFMVFCRLSDRGYILSKTLGLLIFAYLVWIGASLRLYTNTLPAMFVLFSLFVLLSLFLYRRHLEELRAFVRGKKSLILLGEALFAGAFLLFLFLRVLNPDLWQPWNGGEKHMEFAFLNAILKSPYFPPYDPYFAGGYINYYYYGQYLVSILIKLSGVIPPVAFNLAIPTLFALTVSNVFCVGYNLSQGLTSDKEGGEKGVDRKAVLIGLMAAAFVAVLGNLDGMVQIVEGLGRMSGSQFQSTLPGLQGVVRAVPGLPAFLSNLHGFPPFDYWRSTRIIPYTINEFPFFSFLFADLHPHMIGIPFTVLVIALALNITLGVGGAEEKVSGSGRLQRLWRWSSHLWGQVMGSGWGSVASFGLLALSLGAVAVINTWDLPTYAGLILGAFFLQRYLTGGWRGALSVIPLFLILTITALVLYWPFFHYYKALHVGVGLVQNRTRLDPFLVIWGFFLFLVASCVVARLTGQRRGEGLLRFVGLVLRRWEELPRLLSLYRRLVRCATPLYRLALYGLGLVALLIVILVFLGQLVLALLLSLLSLTAFLLLSRRASPPQSFVHFLLFIGLGVLLGVELVYLKDFLQGGDHRRMNTIFKFYIQAWVLLGLGAAVGLSYLWEEVRHWRSRRMRWAWRGLLLFLLLSSSIYPVLGTAARVTDRFPGARPPLGTLDGLAYMTVGSYTWPGPDNRIELKYDYEAIQWLVENVKGTPVIAEAVLPYYREGGLRVSSYTGLPTLLGAHQGEQRYASQVGERDGEAREFFNTPDIARALQLIRKLHISYIYIGQLERTVYDPAGLAKFERMQEEGKLVLAYQNERVRIYLVRGRRGV
ncbi:MAG: DUF2298 domain-containing protein [Anaerolineae bacterium]